MIALLETEHERVLTPEERHILLNHCKRHKIPVNTYDFSNKLVRGTSEYDAKEQLLEDVRQKARELFRREFGASARFREEGTVFDFFWPKARLGVKITGPLAWRRFLLDSNKKRTTTVEDFDCSERSGWSSRYPPGTVIKAYNVPYYEIRHNPNEVVAKLRAKLVESDVYPRLTK